MMPGVTSIREIQDRVGAMNAEKGFHGAADTPKEYLNHYWGSKLLLVVSEIAEAQDELRNGRAVNEEYLSYPSDIIGQHGESFVTHTYGQNGWPGKPEGLPSEIADAVIRLLDFADEAHIDLEDVIERKLAFNATRPALHGKKF
jgi:O-acetyl-ADP-ribose deacetylase (regulator of RNase III)